MNHQEALQQNATEKYLLNELDPELRDQFEEHLFGCQECAIDVRAAAMFVEQSKVILAEPAVTSTVKVPLAAKAKPGWLAWLRPAFAVPVFALLLAVIGYQNFVTYPKLTAEVNQPQVGPWVSVNVSTRAIGEPAKTVRVHAGEGFGVLIELPAEDGFASYAADLYNPGGKLEWSGSLPSTSAEESRQIYIPGRNRLPGTYTLAVRGINASGESKELSRQSIDLQIQ
jgi:anti-sigma factor RsiW